MPELNISLVYHSKETTKELLYNRKNESHLPLTISKSSISGKGLFSTAVLPSSSIVITYTGVLRTIESIDPDGDSLMEVGVADPVQDHLPPLPLFLEPGPKTNAGRYANHGNADM